MAPAGFLSAGTSLFLLSVDSFPGKRAGLCGGAADSFFSVGLAPAGKKAYDKK